MIRLYRKVKNNSCIPLLDEMENIWNDIVNYIGIEQLLVTQGKILSIEIAYYLSNFYNRFQACIFMQYYGIKHEYGFLFQMKRLSLCRWLLLHFLHHLVVCEFDFIDVLKNEFILTNFKYHPRMFNSDIFNKNHWM